MLEEVAQGAGRFARTVATAGAIGLLALASTTSGAAAQQKVAAAGSAGTAWPATVAGCDAIKDLAKHAQCVVEVGTAENLRATQVANEEGACADKLKELRTRDPSVVERGKIILAGQKLQSFGVCKLLGQLSKS